MRAAEESAFARGVSAESLMDEAADAIAETVTRFFPEPGVCTVFAGKGNNAGDALVAAKLLHRRGWNIELQLAFEAAEMGDLAGKKLRRLREVMQDSRHQITAAKGRNAPQSRIALDGLLGLGSTPPLREPILSRCREANRLRSEQNVSVFSIDMPSGLDGDSGDADRDCVVADFTVTIGFAKRGLLADHAANFVGRLEVLPLRDLESPPGLRDVIGSAESLRRLLPRRSFDVHKNQFGRVGILAGSTGYTGAALMCSLGALRAGAGLVELMVPADVYPVVASAAAPEVMVKPLSSFRDFAVSPVNVWAVGPGFGQSRKEEVLDLIRTASQPMVVDADGLNILAGQTEALHECKGPRLLTPHPGEMRRLMKSQHATRAATATDFCATYPVTLLLKGSRSIVAERGRPHSYNTSGNPGMATGGMGDVLTGVCAALLGQGVCPYDAGRLGAWVCGRAAELAIFEGGESEESLLPTAVLQWLGHAFNHLRTPAVAKNHVGL